VLVDGIPHLISAAAGDHLRSLSDAYELAWCTGWEEKADEYLPALLGLSSSLPHLTLGSPDGRDGHWKLGAIDAYAGPERALAWLDDGHDVTCETWAEARRGPTLLVSTDPATGITDEHVALLLRWAERRVSQVRTPEEIEADARRNEQVRIARIRENGQLPMSERLDRTLRLSKFLTELADATRKTRKGVRS
jgi:hypothetical protein